MSCGLAPRSSDSGGTATVSTMLSMTSTNVLSTKTTKIHQRRGFRSCIGLTPQILRTLFH